MQKILVFVANTFSATELQHLRAQFVKMDKDGSGTITIAEMKDAIMSFKSGEGNKAVHSEEDAKRVCTLSLSGNMLG